MSLPNNFDYKTKKQFWVFTWHNYPADYQEKLTKLNAGYLICGEEVSPTTGSPHLQGYCEFKNSRTWGNLIKTLKWCEPAVRGPENNIKYCSKDKNVFTYGEPLPPTDQGTRNDIHDLMKDIQSGVGQLDLFVKHPGPMCKYYKAYDRIKNLMDKQSTKGFIKKDIRIYWGDSGTGKTRTAMEEFPDACRVSASTSGFWWDGYDGEDTVIIDEFRASIPLDQLKNITDGYQCQVAVKGGTRYLRARTIIFTSNQDPAEWYVFQNEADKEAFFRRITKIVHFKKNDF